ncbi:MAG: hypothetical protein ABI948_05585 [Thermoleophilia bacterium]
MRKLLTSFAILAALALTVAVAVASASHIGYSLFGDAAIVPAGNPGNAVKLTSDVNHGFGYGGIDFNVPAGMTFADLHSLATDYKFEADDSCGGGSPRFQVNVTNGTVSGNIFVYIGLPPAYTLCPPNVWLNTGNLLSGVNPIDTSQLPLGFFYDPYAAALLKYGSYAVTGIQLVADGGWAFPDGEQTVFIDNTNIDGTVYTYDEKGHPATKNDCKNGGWMNFVKNDGSAFKNQGDCVSYVNNGK